MVGDLALGLEHLERTVDHRLQHPRARSRCQKWQAEGVVILGTEHQLQALVRSKEDGPADEAPERRLDKFEVNVVNK